MVGVEKSEEPCFLPTLQWRIQGEGPGGPDPPLSNLTLTTLRLKFLHRQDHISLFNWLIFLMKRAWHFSTMICSPLLAKQYFPRQRRPVFTDWETRGRLCFLSWSTIMATIMATTRPITTFFQPVKSSEIENETVNGEEAEAEAWNLKTVSFLCFYSISWEMLVSML